MIALGLEASDQACLLARVPTYLIQVVQFTVYIHLATSGLNSNFSNKPQDSHSGKQRFMSHIVCREVTTDQAAYPGACMAVTTCVKICGPGAYPSTDSPNWPVGCKASPMLRLKLNLRGPVADVTPMLLSNSGGSMAARARRVMPSAVKM